MKKVIIAEKPSVAKNIADSFKIKTRRDGYFEGENYLITWAFGHLLQLLDAKDYDEYCNHQNKTMMSMEELKELIYKNGLI